MLKGTVHESTGPARAPEGAQTPARRPQEEVTNDSNTVEKSGGWSRFSKRLPPSTTDTADLHGKGLCPVDRGESTNSWAAAPVPSPPAPRQPLPSPLEQTPPGVFSPPPPANPLLSPTVSLSVLTPGNFHRSDIPQTPEGQCRDFRVRLQKKKAQALLKKLRTAQCSGSRALAPITRSSDVVSSITTTPPCGRPERPHRLRSERPPRSRGDRPPRPGAPIHSPCPFLRREVACPELGTKGAGPWRSLPRFAHPSGTPGAVPAPPPVSTSSASSSAPLPRSAMFLLRLPPPKNQTLSSGPTPFLGSELSPAPVREEGGGPELRPGPGRGQRASERVLSPPPAPADLQSIHFPSGRQAARLAASSASRRPRPALPRGSN